MLGDLGPWCNYFVAAIFFIVGLHLLGVIPSPFAGPSQVKLKQKGTARRLHTGPDLRTGTRPLHLRLYGTHARHNFPNGINKPALRNTTPADLRHRPLHHNNHRRNLYQPRPEISELERQISHHPNHPKNLRHPNHCRRTLANPHRTIVPQHYSPDKTTNPNKTPKRQRRDKPQKPVQFCPPRHYCLIKKNSTFYICLSDFLMRFERFETVSGTLSRSTPQPPPIRAAHVSKRCR